MIGIIRLYDAFDTIIDARGVYAGGECDRHSCLLDSQAADLSETELTEAQIHFDRSGSEWLWLDFSSFYAHDLIKLNVGVGLVR